MKTATRFAAVLGVLILCGTAAATNFLSDNGTFSQVPAASATYTQSGTGAVSGETADVKIKQLVWIKEFGAACDGSTNDTTAIQNAWNAAAAAGKSVYLGGVGTGACVITSLTAPQPTSGETGNRSALVGDGYGNTILLSNVTGTNCAITIAPSTYGTNGDYNTSFKGFTLKNSGGSPAGYGLCLTNVTRAAFEDIWIDTFSRGVYAVDSIRITWNRCVWNNETIGVYGVSASYTLPNNWTFIAPSFSFMGSYGIFMYNPADLEVYGGDYENNGLGNGTAAVIYLYGNPIDGSKGLTLVGGYFSSNNGIADVLIDNVSGSQNGVHSITGVEFQRVSNTVYVSSNIYINNNGSGLTTLNVSGSGFQGFSTYSASAGRPYVGFLNAATANYAVVTSANYFGSTTEAPPGPWFSETSWTTYTPTLGCASGSLSGSNTPALRYKFTGLKSVNFSVSISFAASAAGTCASTVTFTLPFTAASAETFIGRDSYNNQLWFCYTTAASSTATCITTAGGLPTVNNATPIISGVYERQ